MTALCDFIGKVIVWGIAAFLVFVGIMELKRYLEKRMQGSDSKTAVKTISPYCPYCGYKTHILQSNPSAAFLKCGECYRAWGDESRMSAQEKEQLYSINEDCKRVENLPNLQNILQTVSDLTGTDGWVVFREGKIHSFKSGKMNEPGGKVVRFYDDRQVRTSSGRQHLAVLCRDYCMSQDYANLKTFHISFQLMDNGLSWEWSE